MATSQTTPEPRRRPRGDRGTLNRATTPDGDPTPADNPHFATPGHPDARGTLPMARHLLDPTIEEEIQALARTAPPMTPDVAIRIARMLRWNERNTTTTDRAA